MVRHDLGFQALLYILLSEHFTNILKGFIIILAYLWIGVPITCAKLVLAHNKSQFPFSPLPSLCITLLIPYSSSFLFMFERCNGFIPHVELVMYTTHPSSLFSSLFPSHLPVFQFLNLFNFEQYPSPYILHLVSMTIMKYFLRQFIKCILYDNLLNTSVSMCKKA